MMKSKIWLLALTTFVAIASTSFASDFPALLTAPQGLAQGPTDRKVEADRILLQGGEQVQASQPGAALQSFQQALTLYREMADRSGEARALLSLGEFTLVLGTMPKRLSPSSRVWRSRGQFQAKD